MIVVDYLQLIEPDDRRIPREQQVATISRQLKFLAKDLDVPVICLAQLNRAVETRENKRPRLSDLRESGAIEQDADVVMFLDRPPVYDPKAEPSEAYVIIGKNRHGKTGDAKLHWDGPTVSFRNPAPPRLAEVGPLNPGEREIMPPRSLFDPPTNQVRHRRQMREEQFGPNLTRWEAQQFGDFANPFSPNGPVFGKRFTVETVRQDGVLGRLLLFALEYPPTIDTKHTASAAVALKE